MAASTNWKLYPIKEYSELVAQWDSLNTETANTILLSSDFLLPLLKYFSTGKEFLALRGNPNNPEAMAIINRTGFGRWTTFQPSQAPIGFWLQKPELDTENLCSSLTKKIPGLVLVFSITQQDPEILKRPNDNKNIETLDYIETARISVDFDFTTYWSQRGKNLKQGLRRQRNKLERENISTTLKKSQEISTIGKAIQDYGELESKSWKAKEDTAINIDNKQGKFYQDLLTNFSKRNQAVIYQYLYNDQLAATDLCIYDENNIIILKTTYDEKIEGSSPAMLMRQDAFQEIIDGKLCNNIEFYGKVMDWHRKWSTEIRRMYHINFFNSFVLFLKKLLNH